MHFLKRVFFALIFAFGLAGLFGLLTLGTYLPIIYVFLGLILIINAKESYDINSKRDAAIFLGIAIFIFIFLVYNSMNQLI